MTKEELYDIICKYYEYLYSKVVQYNDFVFIPTEKEKKEINNFIVFLNKKISIPSIGNEWLWGYMLYAFKARDGQKNARYRNHIPVNWVIGKKAYDLYEKRPDNWAYITDELIEKYNIPVKQFNGKLVIKTDQYHEDLRKEYTKDAYPLHLCFHTVSYSKRSKFCLLCVSNSDCKSINN